MKAMHNLSIVTQVRRVPLMQNEQFLIPDSDLVNVATLNKVFRNCDATYKYYWLISILDLIEEKQSQFPIRIILPRMVANAWYPITKCHLNFGYHDRFAQVIEDLRKLGYDSELDTKDLVGKLLKNKNKEYDILDKIGLEVPYHFLTPWTGSVNSKKNGHHLTIKNRTLEAIDQCIYTLQDIDNEECVVLNPSWHHYLWKNKNILRQFCYWNLCRFLQKRKPDAPAIVNKLYSQKRSSLETQRKFWEAFLEFEGSVPCLYSNLRYCVESEYDLDHFIPHYWVGNDLVWNLYPINRSINSKKLDKLPPLKVVQTLGRAQFKLFSSRV